MELKILEILNIIREGKGLTKLSSINHTDNLRENYDFTSFELAELTVRIEEEFNIDIFEDGLVLTIGEVIEKLNRQ